MHGRVAPLSELREETFTEETFTAFGWNCRMAAHHVRAECGVGEEEILDLEPVLASFFPLACVSLPALSVEAISQWLARHESWQPPSLVCCHDRRLHGAIVAWRGCGLIFVDAGDEPHQRRFTVAHEAGHFFGEHFFPRREALRRFGPEIQPALDGLRAFTRVERIDALLSRVSLTWHAHLLARHENDAMPDIDQAEFLADGFACEILAPQAALLNRFPLVPEASIVSAALRDEWHLPANVASRYARDFVMRFAAPPSPLVRLGLV